jgi:EcsC protein family
MRQPAPIPEHFVQSASFLTPQEREQLWRAAIVMADSRGLLLRLTAVFGRRIDRLRTSISRTGERLGGSAWTGLVQRAADMVEDTLWSSYNYATFGLEVVPEFARPKQPRANRLHRLVAAASGAASGFAGFPGVVFDIPFTTVTILRSIAEVARDSGEDLSAEDTRRACLEVLAFGGPDNADDETELGYWATRLGVNHLTINVLIKSAAGRFGMVISDKIMAQAVPVAGAITGGLLNYAFTEYYQKMARVHFCLRALERRTGETLALQQCFDQMVQEARDRRRVSRRSQSPAAVKYLPREHSMRS